MKKTFYSIIPITQFDDVSLSFPPKDFYESFGLEVVAFDKEYDLQSGNAFSEDERNFIFTGTREQLTAFLESDELQDAEEEFGPFEIRAWQNKLPEGYLPVSAAREYAERRELTIQYN